MAFYQLHYGLNICVFSPNSYVEIFSKGQDQQVGLLCVCGRGAVVIGFLMKEVQRSLFALVGEDTARKPYL